MGGGELRYSFRVVDYSRSGNIYLSACGTLMQQGETRDAASASSTRMYILFLVHTDGSLNYSACAGSNVKCMQNKKEVRGRAGQSEAGRKAETAQHR